MGHVKPKASCYLCGKPATTKDHIPPKALFARPRPNNLLTLACCQECQRAYSLDEEYFRNNISMISDYGKAKEIWEATRRSYRRRPRIFGEITSRVFPVRIGANVLPVVRFDRQRTSRVLAKIAKGLVYHHTGRSLPSDQPADVLLDADLEKIDELIRQLPYRRRWGKTFGYVGGMATDEPDVGLWILIFFASKVFLISFGTAVYQPEPTSNNPSPFANR